MGQKNCENHRIYTAGCPDCLHRSRIYESGRRNKTAEPKKIKLAYGDAAMWAKMTEIGLRHQREGKNGTDTRT